MNAQESEPRGAAGPSQGDGPPGEDATDLEYDLAHEAMSGADEEVDRRAPLTQVVTHTETADGDYGYDMSHDVSQ